jgi:plastocyanin
MTAFSGGTVALILSVVCGDITGHAVITRRLSKKAVAPANYSLRGAQVPAAATDNEPFSEFDRMVVILEGGKSAPRAAENLTIEQRNGRFEPDLVVLPVGSTVQFPNSDPIFHNVFSLSHAQSFDLGYYPKGQTRSVKFNREGIVQVYCHIHANMYAAIVVTASPWYTKPSGDGSFSWNNIPAGHYRVTVWHKVAGTFKTEVNVPESGSADVTIRVPVDTGDAH